MQKSYFVSNINCILLFNVNWIYITTVTHIKKLENMTKQKTKKQKT